MAPTTDVAIIGGGIVGLATALSLAEAGCNRITVLEAEDGVARHQTGNNSGVIHSGLYYKPGSEKARTCAEGRELLYRFCAEHGVAHERCGKVVVALDEGQIPALDELERRGKANGLAGIERLDSDGLRLREPHVAGIAGLFVPQTGIVDYKGMCRVMARRIEELGGAIRFNSRLETVDSDGPTMRLGTRSGELETRHLINCGGLQSDRVAWMCGVDPGVRIVPFRGEYYDLTPDAHHLVKNLIYPVPDPRFPFLGVHFTRMALGGVEAGPNAVLAFKREGYKFLDISLRDMFATLSWPGFWKMAWRHWGMALGEYHRSLSKKAFHKALARLVPELKIDQIQRSGAGVRAQAMDRSGKLVDDFHIVGASRQIHVLNAPSPAATACLSIGKTIARKAAGEFGLHLAIGP
ncbi:MAG: L-2-hydroxyglutarate oxidase [Gemmataceae bacterium]|nr:L-2-hydroxyglutarate oxidase [Gemmataceae bacterium]